MRTLACVPTPSIQALAAERAQLQRQRDAAAADMRQQRLRLERQLEDAAAALERERGAAAAERDVLQRRVRTLEETAQVGASAACVPCEVRRSPAPRRAGRSGPHQFYI
jgi:uncharacterized membrane-anchored protein